LRAALGTGAVITRSLDKCLSIYPAARWEALARAFDDFVDVRYEARLRARSLFSGAVPCEFDRQGRVVIPAFLREHAELASDVVVVGVNSRVEIWDPDAWRDQCRQFGGAAQPVAALSASGT